MTLLPKEIIFCTQVSEVLKHSVYHSSYLSPPSKNILRFFGVMLLNAIGTHLRDPINSELTRGMAVDGMDGWTPKREEAGKKAARG